MPRKSQAEPQPEEDLTASDPPSIDPYAVLRLSATATADEIKSAYRRLALRHHPDKASLDDRETAHKTFQEIAFAYAILSDERRRKRYDATGNTAESANIDDEDFNWTEFFREQTENVVRGEMIEQVKKEYQGTDEERDDILAAYEQGEGDMDAIFENVMCSEVLVDDDRFRKIIDQAIADGEVQAYRRYTKEGQKSREQRKARAKKEAAEAEELAHELGVHDKLFGTKESGRKKSKAAKDDTDGLKTLIQQRQKSRAQNFFDDLEAKYGGGTKKKRKTADEPSEEAFQKNSKKSKRGIKA